MGNKKKGKRYREEQIIRILDEVRNGKSVAQVCREYGVAETTVYRWRNQYGNMDQSQLRRLKEVEAENRRLKKIVAQQALDIDMLTKDFFDRNEYGTISVGKTLIRQAG
jgi:putative transposase